MPCFLCSAHPRYTWHPVPFRSLPLPCFLCSLLVRVSVFFAPFFPSLIDGSHFHHIHPHSYAIARICGVLLACTCGLRRLRRSTISGLWNKRPGTWMFVGVFDCLKSLLSCLIVSFFAHHVFNGVIPEQGWISLNMCFELASSAISPLIQ